MSLERIIILSAWVIGSIALLFLRKCGWREKLVIFLSGHVLSWFLSLMYVQMRWIENPVREFPHATSANFTFNYMLYPAIGVYYVILYPAGKHALVKLGYSICYAALTAALIVICERYTDLIEFVRYHGFLAGITFLASFYLMRKYYEWFFRKDRKASEGVLS